MTQDKLNKSVEIIEKKLFQHLITYTHVNENNETVFDDPDKNTTPIKLFVTEFVKEIKSLLQSDNETTYTRKQLQEACSKAYYRGVDNKPILDRFDEYLNEEDNAKLALYCNDNQWHCPKCDVMFSDRSLNSLEVCMCGQKLTWPDNQKKGE